MEDNAGTSNIIYLENNIQSRALLFFIISPKCNNKNRILNQMIHTNKAVHNSIIEDALSIPVHIPFKG